MSRGQLAVAGDRDVAERARWPSFDVELDERLSCVAIDFDAPRYRAARVARLPQHAPDLALAAFVHRLVERFADLELYGLLDLRALIGVPGFVAGHSDRATQDGLAFLDLDADDQLAALVVVFARRMGPRPQARR